MFIATKPLFNEAETRVGQQDPQTVMKAIAGVRRIQLIVLILACSGAVFASGQDYTVSNLGLGGSCGWTVRQFNAHISVATAFNDAGQVVGWVL